MPKSIEIQGMRPCEDGVTRRKNFKRPYDPAFNNQRSHLESQIKINRHMKQQEIFLQAGENLVSRNRHRNDTNEGINSEGCQNSYSPKISVPVSIPTGIGADPGMESIGCGSVLLLPCNWSPEMFSAVVHDHLFKKFLLLSPFFKQM